MFVCQIYLSQSLNKFQRHEYTKRWWGYWLRENEDIHWLIILIDIWYHTGSESNIIIFLFIIWNQHVPALPRRWWLCFKSPGFKSVSSLPVSNSIQNIHIFSFPNNELEVPLGGMMCTVLAPEHLTYCQDRSQDLETGQGAWCFIVVTACSLLKIHLWVFKIIKI